MSNTNLTELVFILDRSGSMYGCEAQTIQGYNRILTEQKRNPEHALVTTVLFDDQIEIVHDRRPINRVEKLTNKTYFTRGSTALYDAVGKTIQSLVYVYKNTPEAKQPHKVIFVIITDGYENASCEFDVREVSDMIKLERDVYHWDFMFLGANIDSAQCAENIGIDRNCAADFDTDGDGMDNVMHGISEVIDKRRYENCELKAAMSPAWRKNIRRRN
ncbi:MAG: VWA domain-containing protein [Proteobacteria bacterium]|nr:VWA domain-containing protein [Pseudomonadota bacterium]